MNLTKAVLITFLLLLGCDRSKNEIDLSGPGISMEMIKAVTSANDLSDLLQLERRAFLKISGRESLFGEIRDVQLYDGGFILMDSHIGKKVLYFDSQGEFVGRIGGDGDGPGEYRHPVCLYVQDGGEIIILNNGPLNFNIYSSPDQFLRAVTSHRFRGIVDPQRILGTENGYLFHVLGRGGNRIRRVNRDFQIVGSFYPDEPQQKILMAGGGDICLVGDRHIWAAGAYDPTISIFTLQGEQVGTTGEHLLDKDYVVQQKDANGLKKGNTGHNLDHLRKKQWINIIMNLQNEIILVGRFIYDGASHYDIYDPRGALLREQLPFNVKWQHIVSESQDRLIAYTMGGPEIDARSDASAILYVYRLKDTEEMARVGA